MLMEALNIAAGIYTLFASQFLVPRRILDNAKTKDKMLLTKEENEGTTVQK